MNLFFTIYSRNLANCHKVLEKIISKLKIIVRIKLADLREEKIRIEGFILTHNDTVRQISERIKEQLINIGLDENYKIQIL